MSPLPRDDRGNKIESLPNYVKELFKAVWPLPPGEPLPPLTRQVKELEERAEKALALAGEILATICLDENQRWFSKMPEDWHMMVHSWRMRYHVLAPEKKGGDAP